MQVRPSTRWNHSKSPTHMLCFMFHPRTCGSMGGSCLLPSCCMPRRVVRNAPTNSYSCAFSNANASDSRNGKGRARADLVPPSSDWHAATLHTLHFTLYTLHFKHGWPDDAAPPFQLHVVHCSIANLVLVLTLPVNDLIALMDARLTVKLTSYQLTLAARAP